MATAAQGLLGTVTATNAGLRGAAGTVAQTFGFYGREGYNLDVSNPQNIPHLQLGGWRRLSEPDAVGWALRHDEAGQHRDRGGRCHVGADGGGKGRAQGVSPRPSRRSCCSPLSGRPTLNGAALDALAEATDDHRPSCGKAQVYAQILTYWTRALRTWRRAARPSSSHDPGFCRFRYAADVPAAQSGDSGQVDLAQVGT